MVYSNIEEVTALTTSPLPAEPGLPTNAASRRLARMTRELAAERGRASALLAELAAARRSETDAKLLVREVDHRAKNSLQLAAAMLDLQARRSNDGVRAELGSAIRRLETLAAIHAALHAGEDAHSVRVRAWLERICLAFDPPQQVAVAIEAPDVDWPAPLVRALGLFAGEAVANALKYAFPDGASGWLSVRVTPAVEGYWALEIADDGIGRPDAIREGLGCQLLRTFARQLQGEVRFGQGLGGRGVGVSLMFPITADAPPALL